MFSFILEWREREKLGRKRQKRRQLQKCIFFLEIRLNFCSTRSRFCECRIPDLKEFCNTKTLMPKTSAELKILEKVKTLILPNFPGYCLVFGIPGNGQIGAELRLHC